jgi:hypothetical protein
MKHLKQKYNLYDTLHLTIPGDAIIEPNSSLFTYNQKVSSQTGQIIESKSINHNFTETNKGINNFDFIPLHNYWDIKVSGKILGKKYHEGISWNTIEDVFREIIDRGICKDIDANLFLKGSSVRRADNTFNLKVSDTNMTPYYDSLDLISADTKLGKKEVFIENGIGTTGVVIKKNINKTQPITIYNKIEESKSLYSKKRKPGESIDVFCEREYGMEYGQFLDYFENVLRIELRTTDRANLRPYADKSKRGSEEVSLWEMLSSPYNMVDWVFNRTISSKQTNELIKSLDLIYDTKQNIKTMKSFEDFKYYCAVDNLMRTYQGDEKLLMKGIENIFYEGKRPGQSVRRKIQGMCREWRMEQMRVKKGTAYTGTLTKKYKEIETGINNL